MNLWTIHKASNNRKIRTILKWIQRQLFDSHDVFSKYHHIVGHHKTVIKFLTVHRELIINVCGRNVMRELILNFRSRVGYKNPNKLFSDFQRYVVQKNKQHSSDIAIACNLLKNIQLTPTQRQFLIQYVIDRIDANKTLDRVSWSNMAIKQKMLIERVRRTGKYNQ